MALKQAVLHVGLHKTATSSFQKTCGSNRKKLEAQGIHYPQFKIDGRTIYNHSIPIFSVFCDQPEKYNVNIKWGYSDQIDRVNALYKQQLDQALDHSSVLFSGEDISMLSPSRLSSFKNYLTERGFELRVLCAVRKPYSFTCSEIQQKVRGGILGDIQHTSVPRKSRRVAVLQETFENTEFFSFEVDCQNPAGPVGALLERIGVDHSNIRQIDLNEGLGNITTRLYADINKAHPILRHGKLNPMGRDREVINFDNNKFLLNTEELLTMKDAIEEENREYRRLLGDDFTDNAYPISEPFSIDIELATAILQQACRPPYVRESVEGFLARYSDNHWDKSDLAGITLLPSGKGKKTASGSERSIITRATGLLRSTVNRLR